MSDKNENILLCLQNINTSIYKPNEQACIPVFRSLPINLRTIIQRMLFVEDGKFSEGLLQAQIIQHNNITQILEQGIKLKLIKGSADEKCYQLDPYFKQSLRDVIEGRSQTILQRLGTTIESEQALKSECCQKWKSLFDLISKRDKNLASRFRQRVQSTLNDSKLLERNSGAGFSFILSTTHKQINQILRYYVQKQSSEVLRFILCLSVLNPLHIYKVPDQEWEKEVILDLAEFGFIQKAGGQMKITYLFWNFLYEEPIISIGIQCSIIVEANFRIYAYLNSGDPIEEDILCNLLGLFSEIKKRFTTLIIADLSEQSIRKACSQNLEAKQIIQFLEMNSKKIQHNDKPKEKDNSEELKKRLDFLRVFQEGVPEKAIIPHNVVQQIQFWENQYKQI